MPTQLLWLTERSPRHQQSALKAAPDGLQVTIQPPDFALFAPYLPQTDFVISERRTEMTSEMLDLASQLKLIVRLGSLVDDIDLAACQQRGILVSCQPVDIAIAVAEHLMMQMLALLKRLNEAHATTIAAQHDLPASRTDENTFSYNWSRFAKVQNLRGKTIAIIGMGEIGVELVRRLRAFLPSQIFYNKRTPHSPEVETQLAITYATFEECVAQADILVNLLPYSPETDLKINAGVFQQMKAGGFLVHAGSGSTLHEQDLIEALEQHLGGAALDTYEYEPLQPNHPLSVFAQNPAHNLLLTPHIAAGTGTPDRSADYAEVVRFLAGQPLQWRVV